MFYKPHNVLALVCHRVSLLSLFYLAPCSIFHRKNPSEDGVNFGSDSKCEQDIGDSPPKNSNKILNLNCIFRKLKSPWHKMCNRRFISKCIPRGCFVKTYEVFK